MCSRLDQTNRITTVKGEFTPMLLPRLQLEGVGGSSIAKIQKIYLKKINLFKTNTA